MNRGRTHRGKPRKQEYAIVTRQIEFFFDFQSPFSYFVHTRLPRLADEYGYTVVYKPFNMHLAKRTAGNTTPPTPLIPAKFRYVCSDFRRWADRYGIPFIIAWEVPPDAPLEGLKVNLPKTGLDTTRANKAMFYAIDRGDAREFATRLWAASYGSGRLVGSDEVLQDVARDLGWPVAELMAFTESETAASRYEDNTREAISRGVFGAPTMLVDEEMWWGNDRLVFVEEYLAAHPG